MGDRGIIELWQVSARNGLFFAERGALDCSHIRDRYTLLGCGILLRPLSCGALRRGVS